MVAACAFVRVSTNEQSVENQRKIVEQYAKRNGYDMKSVLELKGSGYQNSYTKNLPNYVKQLCRNGVKHIIVHSVDRLARSVVAFVTLITKLPRDTTLHFLAENIHIQVDEFFPGNLRAVEVFNAMNTAQAFSAGLSDKIKRTRSMLKDGNKHAFVGGAIPHGMKVVQLNGQKVLQPDKEYLEVQKLVSWLVTIKGLKFADVATVLNARSIYMPFWRKGQREYVCWNEKHVRSVNSRSFGSKSKPKSFDQYDFDNINMELTVGEEQESQYVEILDEAKLFGAEHVKLKWRTPQPNGMANVSWIPKEHI